MSDLPALVAATGDVSSTAQRIAVIGTVLALVVIVELVRRRRLVERYALLWMIAALVLVVLAVWNDGLATVADAVGVKAPVNALFLLGLAAVFALALHFSVAISRLSEETKILAQENARLDAELRAVRGELPTRNGNGAGHEAEGRTAAPGKPVE